MKIKDPWNPMPECYRRLESYLTRGTLEGKPIDKTRVVAAIDRFNIGWSDDMLWQKQDESSDSAKLFGYLCDNLRSYGLAIRVPNDDGNSMIFDDACESAALYWIDADGNLHRDIGPAWIDDYDAEWWRH